MTDNPAEIGEVIKGSYNFWLVFLSWLIAVFASFTAIEISTRVGESEGTVRKWWVTGCAFVMGGGIWVMHFIAMLAMDLPIPVAYGPLITLLSFAVAVVASGYAFNLTTKPDSLFRKVVVGGSWMGAGIALMHYMGMAAMKMDAQVVYDLRMVILSVLIAVMASMMALWLPLHFCKERCPKIITRKIVSANMMGIAIVGMHYTGIASATFLPAPGLGGSPLPTLDSDFLALATYVVTFLILSVAIIVAIANRRIKKLKKINEELERRVQERTWEIQVKNRELDKALNQAVEYASLVQKGFLPEEPPSLEGFVFAAKTVPARQVGGDFYDFIPMEGGKLGILIGDVSGKGVPAALNMARLVSDFRYASRSYSDPAMVMKSVNKILCQRSKQGMFATGIFILLDIENKKLLAVNAGHHSILIREQGNRIVEKGGAGGIPLGILPEANYVPEEISLESGNMVVLYTDGATEPQNASNDPFGKNRLADIISGNNCSPDELIAKIQLTIKEFTRNVLPFDDLTCLAIKVL